MKTQDYPTFMKEFTPLAKMMKMNATVWENARVVMVDIPVDKKAVRKVLPHYMKLTEDAMASLFIADYPTNIFTVPYKEAALLLHVKTPMGKGVHCAWMVVDDDTALIYGREVLGFPKKLADFTFEDNGNRLKAGLKRRGHELFSMDAIIRETEPSPPPMFANKMFNVRNSTKYPLFHSIWMFRPGERVKTFNHADVDLKITESENDPIYRLVSGNPKNGRVVTLDILNGTYLVPVGLTTFRWYVMSHTMRYK